MNNIIQSMPIMLYALIVQTSVHAYESLDDRQLDNVVAGTQANGDPGEIARIPIMMSKSNGSKMEGEIILQRLSNQTSGSLILQDSAQSNLHSMININAVNSPVNVLLNLNININSTVGILEQLNLQGRL